MHSRMWPTMAHVTDERIWMGAAICKRDEMILRIMAAKNLHGIAEKHLNYRKHTVWAPQLPPDRAQLIQEITMRKQEGIISDELAIEKLADAPDMKREMQLIQDMQKQEQELQLKQKQMEMDNQMALAKARATSQPKGNGNAQ